MARLNIKTRIASFLIILTIYIVAFFIALFIFYLSKNLNILISSLLADIAATLVVWGFGVLFRNSSVYDPYWSVAPVVIIICWITIKIITFSVTDILLLAVIIIWAFRLTLNWAIRWKDLNHQDWRYIMLKERSPKIWFFTNLIGINLMPTIIVFISLVPAYFGIGSEGVINVLTIIGFVICLGAVLIEFIADRQMDLFKKSNPSKNQNIERGLWNYSRHPNYFGEVSFWWGIWLMQIGVMQGIWITITGPVVMTLLFVFISIPMMEKHILESKPYYRNYQKQVSMLIPWIRKKS